MKLASSVDVWISQFKTLKMYPFQLLVAAYYNQTGFFLSISATVLPPSPMPFYRILYICNNAKNYNCQNVGKETKKGNHMPLPALRPFFPGLKIATSTNLVSFLLYSKSANKFCRQTFHSRL